LEKPTFYHLHGAYKIAHFGTKLLISEIEKMGYKFVSPPKFQYLGAFCCIVKNNEGDLQVYHGIGAGWGEINFKKTNPFDTGAIEKYLNLGTS